jgi:hypothetical protein
LPSAGSTPAKAATEAAVMFVPEQPKREGETVITLPPAFDYDNVES